MSDHLKSAINCLQIFDDNYRIKKTEMTHSSIKSYNFGNCVSERLTINQNKYKGQ